MMRVGSSRSRLLEVVMAFSAASITLASPPVAAQSLDQLSGRDATAGLKAALNSGAAAAVESLGRTDGFWANPKVRIPLPDQLQRVRSALRLIGKAEEIDALELAINRAAEQAVPQAKTLLTNAVKSMNVDYAKQILRGGDEHNRCGRRRSDRRSGEREARPRAANRPQ